MEVGKLTVNVTADTSAFKEALSDATAAVEQLEAAIAKLRTTSVGVNVDG